MYPFNQSAVFLMQVRRRYFRLQSSRLYAAKKIPWQHGSVEENNEEEVQQVCTHLLPTDYFQIPHNALWLPLKFCIRYCFHILVGIYSPSKKDLKTIVYAKFMGGGGWASRVQWTHNRHKKITDHNEQRAKRERK